jgi:hypothetical protein
MFVQACQRSPADVRGVNSIVCWCNVSGTAERVTWLCWEQASSSRSCTFARVGLGRVALVVWFAGAWCTIACMTDGVGLLLVPAYHRLVVGRMRSWLMRSWSHGCKGLSRMTCSYKASRPRHMWWLLCTWAVHGGFDAPGITCSNMHDITWCSGSVWYRDSMARTSHLTQHARA